MTQAELTEQDWQVRLFIHDFFREQERPPTCQETAHQFTITGEEARQCFERLNQNHRIFLEPGSDVIRMAHPFSAVPTPYRVTTGGHQYYANCAWDSLGIPAALHDDARIEATLPSTGETVTYGIQSGQLIGSDAGIVHFLKPFGQWYDDLIDT